MSLSFAHGYDKYNSTLTLVENVQNNSSTLVGNESLKNAVDTLRRCILNDTTFLLFMVSKNSGKAFDRVAKSPEGMGAVLRLMEDLEKAQSTLASIDKDTPTNLDIATELRLQTSLIISASSSLKAIFDSQKLYAEVEDTTVISNTCSVTVEALKSCFKQTPFRLERGPVLAAVNKLIAHDNLKYQQESPLLVLRHYTPSPGMVADVGHSPYLGTLFDTARVWVTHIRKEKEAIDIFRNLIEDYEPSPFHTDLILSLKCTLESEELIPNFRARIKDKLTSNEGLPTRIAICGMYGHGKSTLLNALIGEDIINIDDFQGSPSTGWPITIEYKANTVEPTLKIKPTNLLPLISAIYKHRGDDANAETNAEILQSDLVQRLETTKATGNQEVDVLYNGKQDILSALQSLGKLVVSFYRIPSEPRRNYELNEDWPVLETPMNLLQGMRSNVQFVDLPGFDCIHRDSSVVQAQWQSELKRCDGGIIVFPYDGSILSSRAFADNMRLLAHLDSFKKKPWIAIGTKVDSCREVEREGYDYAFRAASSRLADPHNPPPLTFCSAHTYIAAQQIQASLDRNRNLPNPPPLSELGEIRGADQVLRGLHGLMDNYESFGRVFAKVMPKEIIKSNMGVTSDYIKTNLVKLIAQLRVRDVAKVATDEINKIRQTYDSIISAVFCRKEDIDAALSLCQDFQSEAASFCTNWSVGKLKFMDTHDEIRRKISVVTQTIRNMIAKEWSSLPQDEDSPINVIKLEESYKRIIQAVEDQQKGIVLGVVDLTRRAWATRLGELIHLFGDANVIRRTDDVSRNLRDEVMGEVKRITEQSGPTVIQSYVEKVQASSSTTIWSALNTAPESYKKENTDDTWQIPMPNDSSDPISNLRGWIRNDIFRTEGLNACGFLLVPPISVGEAFPLSIAASRRKGEVEELVNKCVDQWSASIGAQSYRTLYGSLNAVTMIGIETVLDAFSSRITQLQNQADSHDQAQIFSKKEGLLDDVVVAQANAGCAWAAMTQLLNYGL
ncbi:hypothetical protein FRC16_002649 [Serendipita sp. 398]|nr:hypothetical protein FRC16_002649 [Serendipita sp. 398]